MPDAEPHQIFATSLPQLAAVLGVSSVTTIDRYLTLGMPGHNGEPGARGRRGVRNRYLVGPAVAWMRDNVWNKAATVADAEPSELEKYQARCAQEKWIKMRLDRLEREGVLVPIEVFDRNVAKFGRPLQQAGKELQLKYGVDAFEILDEAIEDALSGLDVNFDLKQFYITTEPDALFEDQPDDDPPPKKTAGRKKTTRKRAKRNRRGKPKKQPASRGRVPPEHDAPTD